MARQVLLQPESDHAHRRVDRQAVGGAEDRFAAVANQLDYHG